MNQNDDTKQKALDWLNEKVRSNEEIADKMVECINRGIEATLEYTQRTNKNELTKMLFAELLKPPTI